MIAKLMKAVLEKHGPFVVGIDSMGRFELRYLEHTTGKNTIGRPAFGIISVLISALADSKREEGLK